MVYEKFYFNLKHVFFISIFRYVFLGIFGPILLLIVCIILINLLQVHAPKCLPHRFQTWSWLPRPFRTLAWYDEHLFSSHKRLICCNGSESKKSAIIINRNNENNCGITNQTFDDDSDRLSGISTRL